MFCPSLRDRHWRYAVFFSTYLYQGLVAGFSLTALANFYAQRGISVTEIGLHFAVAGLPWTVQPILWGPVVDRASRSRMGRRRVWSVLAILAGQGALGGLLLAPDADALASVSLVFFLHSLAASLLDTACDRMIMDHVPTAELGRTSACTRSGFVAGSSVSAVLFAWTLPEWGLGDSALLLLGLGSIAIVLPLLVRESPDDALLALSRAPDLADRPTRVPFRRFLKRLVVGLRRPAALRILVLCFGIDAALSLFEVPFGVHLIQTQGWDAAALSRCQAGLGFVGGTLGAIVVGRWSDRAGPWRVLRILLLASAAGFLVAGLLIALGIGAEAGLPILGLTTILPNLLIVALVPALMQTSRNRPGAATQFEVFMATMNLGSVAGASAAGVVMGYVALAWMGLLVAAAFLACLRLLPRTPVASDGPL